MIKFPVRNTNVGKIINSYLNCDKELDDHTVHLLFSANRWEMKQEITTNLEMGVNVIVDWYAHSGVAYTAAKPGFNMSWCKNSDTGLPKPDMVCFLNVSEEIARQRPNFGEEKYEIEAFQREVKKKFLEMFDSDWVEILADEPIDEVHKKI